MVQPIQNFQMEPLLLHQIYMDNSNSNRISKARSEMLMEQVCCDQMRDFCARNKYCTLWGKTARV